ncbi:O-antigen ligase [Ruminococcaceae bacterium YRB3002]|nr:O-antigen ligase [Ruminococcaceae bacterium YRB3002]
MSGSGHNNNKSKSNIRGISPQALKVMFALFPFINGLFYEWQAALASLALTSFIVYAVIRSRSLKFNISLKFITALLIPVMHIISAFTAVDSGMAVMGFIKFLPLPLFVLAADQTDIKDGKDLLEYLPYSAAVMVIMSVPLSFVEVLRGHIIVSGRLGGFFEYPNTFAMFLLICAVYLLFRDEIRVRDWILALIAVTGIVLSGSRTVMALSAVALVVFIITVRSKKLRIIAVSGAAGMAVIAGIYVLATGRTEAVGRLFTSLTENSTFTGRFLYWKDALPVILKHPLGLGYYGYSFTQGSFQTGVYSVIHIHNDLLQILLDIGWIPAVVTVILTVRSVIKADRCMRMILVLSVLHSLFDIDLQFASVALILLAVADGTSFRSFVIRKGAYVTAVLVSMICIASATVGTCSACWYWRADAAALSIYPFYTPSRIRVLQETSTAEDMDREADAILAYNSSVSIAYSAKARTAFARGDVLEMIENKKKAIELNRYDITEYTDYIDMLQTAVTIYAEAGDYDSAMYCVRCVLEVPDMLEQVKAGTSELAWKIDDKPVLTLPDEYQAYVSELENLV